MEYLFLWWKDIGEWNIWNLKSMMKIEKKKVKNDDKNFFSTLFGNKNFVPQKISILADIRIYNYF